MVLVGHSMGGLVSELQTLDSRDDFWNIVSERPFPEVKASNEARHDLQETFFFRPNPSVRRVITIATPFRGSPVANSTIRWLGSKLIKLPQMVVNDRQQLHKDNPDIFRKPSILDVETSIDSLASDSPILPVMLEAQRGPWVKYHNIVGRIPDKGLIGKVVGGSDGAVSFDSAHLEHVDSEIVVNADHLAINRHPLTVLEVHRILLEHLTDINAPTQSSGSPLPLRPPTAREESPWQRPARHAIRGGSLFACSHECPGGDGRLAVDAAGIDRRSHAINPRLACFAKPDTGSRFSSRYWGRSLWFRTVMAGSIPCRG